MDGRRWGRRRWCPLRSGCGFPITSIGLPVLDISPKPFDLPSEIDQRHSGRLPITYDKLCRAGKSANFRRTRDTDLAALSTVVAWVTVVASDTVEATPITSTGDLLPLGSRCVVAVLLHAAHRCVECCEHDKSRGVIQKVSKGTLTRIVDEN